MHPLICARKVWNGIKEDMLNKVVILSWSYDLAMYIFPARVFENVLSNPAPPHKKKPCTSQQRDIPPPPPRKIISLILQGNI